MNNEFPPIPEDLLLALESAFPERSAMPGATLDSLMFDGGKRAVVRFLRAKFVEQNETILTKAD